MSMEEVNDKKENLQRDNLEEVPRETAEGSRTIQPWTKQITVRGIIVSIMIGTIYSVIAMKLNLTTGLVPNLNVSAALLAFVFIRSWTKVVQKAGFMSKPFTRQENTMIQTCAVACYSIAVGVCFVGLFVLIPLRKVMIVDLKLTYPSGLATAVLINGFHSQGDKAANLTYVGAGMICSHAVNLSLLFGAVLSYGIMWPLINRLKGDWFSEDLQESSMKSLYGYKVFVSVALILGDGLYNFIKILCFTLINIHGRLKNKNRNTADDDDHHKKTDEDRKQNEVFLRETIPMWIGVVGYVTLSILSIIVIPIMFPQLKWYYVIVAYILAPSLAFCNAYGAGLTDMNMAYNYGKVALFTLAALTGKENGVVAGLAGCGLIKSVVSVACILMQDFKTAHYTLTSPRAMFLSQAIGTAIGCITAPLSFFLFYKAFDVGNPYGEFKAPYALIYRNMAILGVQGFSALPHHCLQLCYGFFAFAVAVNLVRDLSPHKIAKWMPLPMAMALPFLVGAYFAIDMCIGTLVVFVWHKLNTKKAEFMVPAVASGLICGEGLWILPASILALAKINPPICMKFVPS
ncbi:Oligopeptide transporter OPT superfamily [Corchorus olitorius]|uniref:Oligopeptide transporter OPT superfamily n=1 Tax=Corchorus olitorius TaxID=93759 RepID=A0A1R3K6Y3_9ROSI|nr:Oligopeptide transporter OPT superfamily [Corchorus olitorius]